MLHLPSIFYHVVIWIGFMVFTDAQGRGSFRGRPLLQWPRTRFIPTTGQAGRNYPVWPRQISSTRNRDTQRINAAQQKTPTTTPAPFPAIPRLPRRRHRIPGRWNRLRFQKTTPNPNGTTTTMSSIKAARRRPRLPGRWDRRPFQATTPNPNATRTTISRTKADRRRKIEERKQQRRMFRRQRRLEREKILLEKIKDNTKHSQPSPTSPLPIMLPTDQTGGDQKHSTNSSDTSPTSHLSSWEKQKRKMIEDFRQKQVDLDARIKTAQKGIEILKLKKIRKGQANSQTSSLVDTLNANLFSQTNSANSVYMANASLPPQSVNVFTVTEASVTSPNLVSQTHKQMKIETTPLTRVNHSDARSSLESQFHQTHTIANIGEPLGSGTKLPAMEGMPLGIPLHFIPVNLDTLISNTEIPGQVSKETHNPSPAYAKNSLQRQFKTPDLFLDPRLAVTDEHSKTWPLLDIGPENPAAGHGNSIPLGRSGTIGIKDIKLLKEPLGLPQLGSSSPIKSVNFLTSVIGGLREHIQFHQTHDRHGSSEQLQPPIGHHDEPLPPSIGHPGNLLHPSIAHPGEPLEPSIGHPGEPSHPSFGHPVEPKDPSIIHPGDLVEQTVDHPGDPLQPSVANPGEPLEPPIGHSSGPLHPPIGLPVHPLQPSIIHPGEPLQPLIGHHGEPLSPPIGHPGEPMGPWSIHPGEPLPPSIIHPGEPLQPLIGHPGEPLSPPIGHPGELMGPWSIHSGEPLQPPIGHPGGSLSPSIGHLGELMDPSITHPGEPLQPLIDHPSEPLEPSIAHPGHPLEASVGNPGEPIEPSIIHPGEPLPPFVNNNPTIETFGNQNTTGASDQSSSNFNEGVPLQPSLGQPLGELNPGEPLGLGNEWLDISLAFGQPVTEFQDVDLSTSSDGPTSASSPGEGQSGIQTINGGFLPRIQQPSESTSSVSDEQIMTSGTQLSQLLSGISSNVNRP